MGRARELADGGINDAILMDASAADTDVNDNILINGTDSSSTNAGFNLLYENGTHDAAITLPVGRSDLSLNGGIVQVVQTEQTAASSISNPGGTFVDLSGMSVTITPTSTSSRIFIHAQINITGREATNVMHGRLDRNGTIIHLGDADGSKNRSFAEGQPVPDGSSGQIMCLFVDSPATTDPLIYKIQVTSNNIIFFNRAAHSENDNNTGSRTASSIIAMEILG
tara:strand:- start:146 stop:817 length:672 start_codon:yes stop_codon:yes gene_type:complete